MSRTNKPVDIGMDHRFTWPDEQFDWLAIGILQAGLLVLVAQVQTNDELDAIKIKDFHQFSVAKLPIQHHGTVAQQLFDLIETAKYPAVFPSFKMFSELCAAPFRSDHRSQILHLPDKVASRPVSGLLSSENAGSLCINFRSSPTFSPRYPSDMGIMPPTTLWVSWHPFLPGLHHREDTAEISES